MKRESILTIIESPLQLMCAIEALAGDLHSNKDLIVLQNRGKQSNTHIENILEREWCNWNSISYIEFSGGIEIYRKLWLWRKANSETYSRVYFGDFTCGYMRNFAANLGTDRISLIDDGVGTLSLTKYDLKKANIKSITRDTTLKIFGFGKKVRLKDLHIHTIFDVNRDNFKEVTKNEFANLRKLILQKTVYEDSIYVLGQDLVESGLIDKEIYFDIMKSISVKFREKNLVYIPHRKENETFVKEVIEKFGFQLKTFTKPIEISLIEEETLPKVVISVVSTALFTLPLLYEGMKFQYVEIPVEQWKRNRSNIETIYSELLKKSSVKKFE